MTTEELQDLEKIATDKPWFAATRLKEYLKTVTIEKADEEPTGNYTTQQRKGCWVYMEKKSEQLNDAGLEMRKVLKPEYFIPWTKDSFHDHVWIPIQKAM